MFDSTSLGMSGVSRFAPNRTSAAQGGRSGVKYPSPFFDIGHTYLPPSMKQLLKWCRYYYLVNPLINSVVHKMSEYPITEMVIEEKNPAVKLKWENLLNQTLRYRAFQIEVGLDYHTYGNCFVTIHYPFDKYLICKKCKERYEAAKVKFQWKNLDYILACHKCETVGPADVLDWFVPDIKRIRLIRWNPEYVSVDPSFPGNDPRYVFELPTQLKNDVILGKREILATIPDTFIEAIKRGKNIQFSRDNLFVFKRPIISQKDNGWGMPMILPVLKDTFYLQILRKAQEAIAQEHIVPLRILFPQTGDQAASPYSNIDLSWWKNRVETEIAKWKQDQNYIPILPLPVGNQSIGGDGRALMLHQEMQAWSMQIVAGMGVPQEFVFGGMQYSGSNVSMRMLENQFIGYRTDHELMLNEFVIKRIAAYLGIPAISARMRRFKMADDLQRTAFYFQLNQAGKISDRTLLEECDLDPMLEDKRKKEEFSRQMDMNRKTQLSAAEIQGEQMLVQAKYTARAQSMMPQPMPGAEGAPKPGEGPVPPPGSDGQMGAPQGPQSGAEGGMVDGQQVDPSLPQGTSLSPEDGQEAPQEGIPAQMQSPMTMGAKGGGYNLLYVARRAATKLQSMDDATKFAELNRLKTGNPQIYSLVLQIIQRETGSQADPLNPVQSPLPQQKPSRRAAPVG